MDSLTAFGEPGFITVTRLKGRLKDLDEGFRKSLKERYSAAYGQGSFANYLKNLKILLTSDGLNYCYASPAEFQVNVKGSANQGFV